MARRDGRGLLGLALIGFGALALWLDLDPWHILWYLFAWFGYFLSIDAALVRWGREDVTIVRRDHLPVFLWSIPFWFFFELYNIRIQNWYYVFTFHTVPASFLFSCLAFSTVLPACLLHGKIIEATGMFHHTACPRLNVGGLQIWIAIFGVLCLVLPLALPHTTFWMTWGALACLPEVVAYHVGSPSILRDLEGGQPRRLLSLLVGGAWAGLLWEGLNFGARCKWIYTVPGLEDAKLFEMPVIGFVGFPALALNAYPTYGLIQHVWHTRGSRWSRGLIAIGAVIFVVWGFREMMTHTVRSRRPLLENVAGLNTTAIDDLHRIGVTTPEALSSVCLDRGVSDLAEMLQLENDQVDLACRHAALAIHKGMGTRRAEVLIRNGIGSVRDLPRLADSGLVGNVVEDGRTLHPRITTSEVRVWYLGAKNGIPRR